MSDAPRRCAALPSDPPDRPSIPPGGLVGPGIGPRGGAMLTGGSVVPSPGRESPSLDGGSPSLDGGSPCLERGSPFPDRESPSLGGRSPSPVRGSPFLASYRSNRSAAGAPSPEKAFLLSAALPGAGQYAQGRRRWLAYLAAEVAGWWLVVDRRRAGGRLQDRYRDLAWSVAREGLSEGPRTDGGFDYYEDLSHWERSGTFDRDSDLPGIQPEDDPGTFNGTVWRLARDIFFPPEGPPPGPGDPTYERALEYYGDRAYTSRFLWDWSADPVAWARYGETIEESDDRFRQATLFTGAVVANHLLSAVDAFVTARLSEAAGRTAGIDTRLRPGPEGRWSRARLDLTLFLHPRSP